MDKVKIDKLEAMFGDVMRELNNLVDVEPEYKVGDWVEITEQGTGCHPAGHIGQISKSLKDNTIYDFQVGERGSSSGNNYRADQVKPAQKPEAPKFYKNQPCLMKEYITSKWIPRILSRIVEGDNYPYRTVGGMACQECKPDTTSYIAWTEHTGPETVPKDKSRVIAERGDGVLVDVSNISGGNWDINLMYTSRIIRYFYVPLTEYL
jgi:hypothetical protein